MVRLFSTFFGMHAFIWITEHAHSHAEANLASGEANSEARHHGRSANMVALMLHILGDTLANISVIVSGLIIWLTDAPWRFRVDPIASLVIAFIMLVPTIPFGERGFIHSLKLSNESHNNTY